MIDGVCYQCLEFLSRLASAFGVQASFSPVGEEDLDFLYPYEPSRVKIQHFSKVGRYHRGGTGSATFPQDLPIRPGGSQSLEFCWADFSFYSPHITTYTRSRVE